MITRTSTILLEALKDLSDQAAWTEFDFRFRPLLMAVGRRLMLCDSDAEDAAQETLAAFIVDYRAGNYRRERGRLRDWLTGIMAHKVRDAQRRRHRQPSATAAPGTLELIEDTSVQQAVQQEWSQAILRECIQRIRLELTPQVFESFELFALKQWPAARVSRHLGISPDAVYQNKRRILLRIRQLLPQIEESW